MSNYTSNYNSSEGTFNDIYGTIRTPDQPEIKTLDGLVSIQTVVIPGTAWPFVATLDQDVNETADATFNSVSAFNFYGTFTGVATAANYVTDASQTYITTLNNLDNVATYPISSEKWLRLSELDQDVKIGASPSYLNVTSNLTGNVIGNVTGNLSGNASTSTLATNATNAVNATNATTAVTVSQASQPHITTLPILTNIQATPILSTIWPIVAAMDQKVSSANNVVFNSVTSPNFFGNATSATTAVTVSQFSQPNITTLDNLISIQLIIIPGSVWPFVSTLNQHLRTTNSPIFANVTAPNFFGNATSASSSGSSTTAVTVTGASQPNITTLPILANVYATPLPNTVWAFLATMNQNVSSAGNPSFTSVNSAVFKNTAGSIAIEAKSGNSISFKTLGGASHGTINNYGNWSLAVADFALNTSGLYVSKILSGSNNMANIYSYQDNSITSGACISSSFFSLGQLSVSSGATASINANIYVEPIIKFGLGTMSNNYGLYINANPAGATNENYALKCKGTAAIKTIIGDTTTSTANDTLFLGDTAQNFFIDRAVAGNQINFGYNTPRKVGSESYPFVCYDNSTNRQLCFLTSSAGSVSGTSSAYFPLTLNIGASYDQCLSTYKLFVDGGSTNKTLATFRSGNTSNYANITVGRTSDECRIAIAASTGQFASDAMAGEMIIRCDDSTKYVRLLSGSGLSTFSVSGTNAYFKNIPLNASGNLQVNVGTGQVSFPPPSSGRYKENIVETKLDTSDIYKVKVKEFDRKKGYGEGHDIGLIAEDLHEFPDLRYLVCYDEEKKPQSIYYEKITVYLLAEMQKLLTRVEELEKQLSKKRKADSELSL